MTIANYSHLGMIAIGLGVAISIASIALYLVGGSGISLGSTESSLDLAGTLHFHDTYYILFSTGHRLILLLPLISGIILIATGTLMHRQIPEISSNLQVIQEQNKPDMATPRKLSD